MIRPRRSHLFMPGSNPRALEKARTVAADGIILDLEDAVAPDAKGTARDAIAQTLNAGGFGKREVIIRINALDSPWWIDDVTMAGKAKPDGILVPKISSVEDLAAVADRLSDIGADMSINPPCRGTRGRLQGLGKSPRRFRVRPQRHRARDPHPHDARPRRDAADDHPLRTSDPAVRPRDPRWPLQQF
jgi:hypothetical protein